jgi:hypothetical protein
MTQILDTPQTTVEEMQHWARALATVATRIETRGQVVGTR